MNKIIYRDPQVTIFQSVLFKTNSTVITTEDAILVVDPAWLPDEVEAIRLYVQAIRKNRNLFLIFTHSDYDHIIGYGAFEADKVFTSKAMAENPRAQESVDQVRAFDHQFYLERPYPIEYPKSNFVVFRDGVQYRHGQTKLTFYLAPGHTDDSMMVIVWQLGLCLAGDYLSNVEFPFIYHSSVDYLETLEKLPKIHDRNWFTRLIPGHGDPALSITDWMHRRTESMVYIYSLRESIATGAVFDEETLWRRYKFPLLQRKYHEENAILIKKELDQGLWTWDPDKLPNFDAFRNYDVEDSGEGS